MSFLCRKILKPIYKQLHRRFTTSNFLSLNSVDHEPFLNGTSCIYIEELFRAWKTDQRSVHVSWQTFFKLVENGNPPGSAYLSPINAAITVVSKQPQTKVKPQETPKSVQVASVQAKPQHEVKPAEVPSTAIKYGNAKEHLLVFSIISAYRSRGHLLASLDPLHLTRGPNIRKRIDTEDNPILRVIEMPNDLSVVYKLPRNTFLGGDRKDLPLKDIIERLNSVYCQTYGIELEHVIEFEEELFLHEKLESPKIEWKLTSDQKKVLLGRLARAHLFEFFLSKKWPAEKRFGLEGCDVYVPALRYMMEVASEHGAQHFVIGMAHRGRLNTLANVMDLSLTKIFTQFQPLDPNNIYGQGDVKYHAGSSTAVSHAETKNPFRISLCANPSHLESVNPIVTGQVAGEQTFSGDTDKMKVWPVLVHGDAAICGQGVVYETFHLSELKCFKTGGTLHIVINNQIGFTTDPQLSRSSEYCTAVAKVVNAPIFHVNADDVEAVIRMVHIAADYRAKFRNDIVVDLVGYRRHGHNEVDEPMFTQPIMYKIIQKMQPVYYKYRDQLLAEKVVTENDVKILEDEYINNLETSFQLASKITQLNPVDWLSSPWEKFFVPRKKAQEVPVTGVKVGILNTIFKALSTPPPNMKIHRGIERILNNRKTMFEKKIVDWSVGESFAYASIMQEGLPVRLSGQDVERGTFSHRHHVLHDQENGNTVNVLHNIFPNQGAYILCNSSLSEYGVLGFEYGMSLVNPNALIIWEAQFGDFSNSAQVIFDQYLSSSQEKWYQQAGLTVLLPHGMEGMGPEHSSARPERFLLLSNDDDTKLNLNMVEQMKNCNWFIVNASTPANFFHVLRRQIKLDYRKPVIIFTPKALLRLPACVSPIEDFLEGTKFKPYLRDPEVPPSDKVSKLLLCSGKVYYELREMREKLKKNEAIAIGRIEQLSPLPYSDIYEDATKSYPQASIFWVQEEHKNQGAWSYVAPRLNKLLGKEKGAMMYIGRSPAASPATGHKLIHPKEREQFLFAAINL